MAPTRAIEEQTSYRRAPILAHSNEALPGHQPDAETLQKIEQRKPPVINYDVSKWVDPRRAASYLEDKLPKRDRILWQ